MSLVRTIAPTLEPLTVADLKAHLRVTQAREDGLIADYLASAREACEAYTRRAFLTQTYRLSLDAFPADEHCGMFAPLTDRARRFPGRVIELPRPPLATVSHVKYYDTDDTLQTLSASAYTVDADGLVGCIVLKEDESWPDISTSVPNAVQVTYVAGWTTAALVPATLRQAVRFMVGHLYKLREPVNLGNIVNEIPLTLKAMLDCERIPQFE